MFTGSSFRYGEKTAGSFLITGFGSSLPPVSLLYKSGHTFVNGTVFQGQIIVIAVIAEEIPERSLEKRKTKDQHIAAADKPAVTDREGTGDRQRKTVTLAGDKELAGLRPVCSSVVGELFSLNMKAAAKEIFIGKQCKQGGKALHILLIVKKESLV